MTRAEINWRMRSIIDAPSVKESEVMLEKKAEGRDVDE